MSVFIASINSGSNGNCYYIGNSTEAVLVDVGISCGETQKRMERMNLDMDMVKAIFISHEHIDHIRGVEVMAKRFRLPVYITPPTLQNSRLKIDPSLIHSFVPYEPVCIGGISVTPFPKQHDAADPYSFVIEYNGVKTGVFTDIGLCCDHVIRNFSQCHAVFLEANYDEKMLEESSYPSYLKKRISGDNGHLSNNQSLELFVNHRPDFMSHLLLSHLSKNNNSPELVYDLFTKHAGKTHITVASRYEESKVYHVKKDGAEQPLQIYTRNQMTLF
jgi:phosphoribosyl 1,2-cyclic phosphodiesterase